MENKTKNYGYIADEIQPEDYVLGSLHLPTDILVEKRQWNYYNYQHESQKRR